MSASATAPRQAPAAGGKLSGVFCGCTWYLLRGWAHVSGLSGRRAPQFWFLQYQHGSSSGRGRVRHGSGCPLVYAPLSLGSGCGVPRVLGGDLLASHYHVGVLLASVAFRGLCGEGSVVCASDSEPRSAPCRFFLPYVHGTCARWQAVYPPPRASGSDSLQYLISRQNYAWSSGALFDEEKVARALLCLRPGSEAISAAKKHGMANVMEALARILEDILLPTLMEMKHVGVKRAVHAVARFETSWTRRRPRRSPVFRCYKHALG